MANLCSNELYVESPFTDKLEALAIAINVWSHTKDADGKEYTWRLWNIAKGAGLCSEGVSTRGEFGSATYDAEHLSISFDSAWNPDFSLWDKIFKRYIGEYTVYYTSDEPGCELYLSNDPDYTGKYNIDVYEEDMGVLYEDSNFCASSKETMDYCRKVLKFNGVPLKGNETIPSLIKKLDDIDAPVSIHAWDSESYETFI